MASMTPPAIVDRVELRGDNDVAPELPVGRPLPSSLDPEAKPSYLVAVGVVDS
jgi:hypothetical protein